MFSCPWLFPLWAVGQGGEQGKSETSGHQFAEPQGHELLRIKVLVAGQSLIWLLGCGIPGKGIQMKKRMLRLTIKWMKCSVLLTLNEKRKQHHHLQGVGQPLIQETQ